MNWSLEDGEYKVVFVSGLADEKKVALLGEKIWDGFRDYFAMEGEVAKEVIQQVLDSKMKLAGCEGLQPEDFKLESGSGSLWVMRGTQADLLLTMHSFLKQLQVLPKDAEEFWESYPDLWAIVDQIVPAIVEIVGEDGLARDVEKLRQHVVNMMYDEWNGSWWLIGGTPLNIEVKKNLLWRGVLKRTEVRSDGQERFEYTNEGMEFLKKEGLWVL